MSSGSGGWRTKSQSGTDVDSDDDDSTQTTAAKSNVELLQPGENEHVVVTPPGDLDRERAHAVDVRAWVDASTPPALHTEKGKERAKDESGQAAAGEHEAQATAKQDAPSRSRSRTSSRAAEAHEREEGALEPQGRRSVDSMSVRTEDDEPAMPGSFNGSLGRRRRSGSTRSHWSHQSHHLHPDGLLAGLLRKMKLS